MKNLSFVFNVVLAIAVGVLYYLHFSACGSCSTETPISDSLALEESTQLATDSALSLMPDSLPPAGAVAFVNFDQLTEKYQFYKDEVKALENEFKKKQDELMVRQRKLEEEVGRYQQLAPGMTEEARATREKQLVEEEKKLYDFKATLEGSLSGKENEFNKAFLTKIDGYFKNLSKEKHYDYIFVYSKGGPSYIVYANEKLNITNITLDGLNKQYKAGKR